MKPKLYKINKYFKNITFPYKLLPYWIEEQSKIWTKLSLNPGESKSFYIYYSLKDDTPKNPFNDNSEIAFYRFNGNANDEYGNYNGTWNGNEQYSGGVWDRGAKFDGNSYINTNLTPNYDYLTISFWIKASEISSQSCIFHFSYNDENTLSLWQLGSGGARQLLVNNSFKLNVSRNFLDNKWHHIVITSETKVYVDGVLSDTTDRATTSNINRTLILGADRDTDSINDYFNGMLDNVRIFNRVLTDSEVQYLYNLEKPYFIKQEPEKIFEFFDDFEGNNLDNEKWEIGSGSYSVENSYIKMWGGYGGPGDDYSILHKIKVLFLAPLQIIWKGKCSTSGDIDIGATLFKSSNNDVIARFQLDNQGGSSTWYYWVAININGTGYHNSELAGTEWRLCNTKVYNDKLEFIVEGLTPLSGNYDFSSVGEMKIGIYGDSDSSDRFGYIDYIAIAKLADQEPSISYSLEEFKFLSFKGNTYTKRKLITITNTSSDPLIDYQISLDYSQINHDNIILVEILKEEE